MFAQDWGGGGGISMFVQDGKGVFYVNLIVSRDKASPIMASI